MKKTSYQVIFHEQGDIPFLPVAMIPSELLSKSLYICAENKRREVVPLGGLDRKILQQLGEKSKILALFEIEKYTDLYPLSINLQQVLLNFSQQSPYDCLKQLFGKLNLRHLPSWGFLTQIGEENFNNLLALWIEKIAEEIVFSLKPLPRVNYFKILKRSDESVELFYKIFQELHLVLSDQKFSSLRLNLGLLYGQDGYVNWNLQQSTTLLINLMTGYHILNESFSQELKKLYLRLGGEIEMTQLNHDSLPVQQNSLVLNSALGRLKYQKYFLQESMDQQSFFSSHHGFLCFEFQSESQNQQKGALLHCQPLLCDPYYAPFLQLFFESNRLRLKYPYYLESFLSSKIIKDKILPKILATLKVLTPGQRWTLLNVTSQTNFQLKSHSRLKSFVPSSAFKRSACDYDFSIHQTHGLGIACHFADLQKQYQKSCPLY